MSRSPAIRFYFEDGPARTRSGVWKVWTGKRGEDVYIAPRAIAGEFKLSIHRDGYNQIGYYSQQIKSQVRAADKHYLDRWLRVDVPYMFEGWKLLCALVFNSNEFESEPLVDDGKPVEIINAPASDLDAYVMVLATDDRATAAELEQPLIAELPRAGGGAIALVAAVLPHDPSLVAAVDADNGGFGWQPPATKGGDEPFGFVFARGKYPRFTEYSTRQHSPPPLVPHLPGLMAAVHPWSEAPSPYREMDAFCAVLACSREGAVLHVDSRSHCNQEHLVSDVNDLIVAYRTGRVDDMWETRPDGSAVTAITMPKTADANGIHGYLPNPLKSADGTAASED